MNLVHRSDTNPLRERAKRIKVLSMHKLLPPFPLFPPTVEMANQTVIVHDERERGEKNIDTSWKPWSLSRFQSDSIFLNKRESFQLVLLFVSSISSRKNSLTRVDEVEEIYFENDHREKNSLCGERKNRLAKQYSQLLVFHVHYFFSYLRLTTVNTSYNNFIGYIYNV